MKNINLSRIFMSGFMLVCIFIQSCSKKDETPPPPNYIWDIDVQGIPRFIDKNFIELDKIYRISKFRSSVGHDYSDNYEQCRSKKHYFEPKADIDWTSVKIYCPVSGTITRVEQEWTGTKIEVESEEYPAFRISIFHITLSAPRAVDDTIAAGELLGNHVGMETYSDISVIVNDPLKQGRMVSFFDVLTDDAFAEYTNYGIHSREDLIIPKETRDSNPLTCNGDTFISSDALENWVVLE